MQDIEIIDIVPALPHRAPDAHKGSFGRVLVVGGSRGMIGAAALTANAALRGGAGLATVAVAETVQLAVAALCPCATSSPLTCDDYDELTGESIRDFAEAAEPADILAVGPGMGVGRGQQDLVLAAIEQEKPLVLDADGLNNLATIDRWARRRNCPLVLTPHPGEFARLLAGSVGEIQADRQAVAVAAAREWLGASFDSQPLVLLLKGSATVITDGRRVRINATGNPGMATGGSGDVLTGLVAALLAQGLPPFEAASLAAHAHGRAGDLAAVDLGQAGMIATDILDRLPHALRECV